MKEQFRDIAKEVLDNIYKNLPGLCLDQYVGTIQQKWTKFERTPVFNDNGEVNIPKEKKIMIMILESPHKQEFKGKIGPAKGKTGINIRKHIVDIFGEDYINYCLVLMNAIPFQCSLGITPPEIFRDEVFTKAWENNKIGYKFFEDRLDKLLIKLKEKKVVIVNACTQGERPPQKQLQSMEPLCCNVCKSIINVLEKRDGYKNERETLPFYHIHHPASWMNKNNTRGELFLQTDKQCIGKGKQFICQCKDKDLSNKDRWDRLKTDKDNLEECCYGKVKLQ